MVAESVETPGAVLPVAASIAVGVGGRADESFAEDGGLVPGGLGHGLLRVGSARGYPAAGTLLRALAVSSSIRRTI